jgi:hypothetical protein
MTSTASALAAIPEAKGHTKARVYTPPLPENCDTTRDDGCPCGCGLNPDTSWGFDCIEFLETIMRWSLIPYQKWLYIHALERLPGSDEFRYRTIIVLIARQNGKTQWLKGLGLWKLFVDGAHEVLITAQNLDLAEKCLAQAVADVRKIKLTRREFRRYSTTNGKNRMILWPLKGSETPRHWGTTPSTSGGGRSMSVDLAMLDELRMHHNWEAWNAITPTTKARPRSLNVGASNAGDAKSVVLRSYRDRATAKILAEDTTTTQTGLFEWSVPEGVDYRDPTHWPVANPALGYLPGHTIRDLIGVLEELEDNIAGFKTEYLCMWVDTLAPGVLPAADWSATTDKESARKPGAPVWASLDVNYELTEAYVGICAERSDGLRHNEVVAAERGTDWIVDWFRDPKRLVEDPNGPMEPLEPDGKRYRCRFEAVVIQAKGAPASQFIEKLREIGVPVLELGGTELTKCYADYYRKLTGHRIMHRPSPTLDAAAQSAQAKNLGDEWVMDRKKSNCSPVVAVIQATWAESAPREPIYASAYENASLAVL